MNTLKKYWAVIIASIFMTLISCVSFFAGYKVGKLHNTVKWPVDIAISSVELAKDTCISIQYYDTIQTFVTDLNTPYMGDLANSGGSFKISPNDGKPSKVINLRKYVDTVKLNKQDIVPTSEEKNFIDYIGIRFEKDTFYIDSSMMIRHTSWFEQNLDMPYTTLDLKEYLKDSAFKIELTHLGGIPEMYSDTFKTYSVNIQAYPIGSFKKDTAFKEYEDSSGTYKIKYVYGGGWSPLVIGAETHYDATITVYRLFTETGYQPLAEFDGTYVEHGCFEDVPKDWVSKALKQ